MNFSRRKELLLEAISASLQAGQEILKVYQSEDFEVQLKSDNTPLTIADQRAHNKIVSILERLEIPILSEEGEHLPYAERQKWEHCWIVDPLDGTKEFIKRNDEFTVNIALIDKARPVAGVIYVPVLKQLYFADLELGAYRIDNVENWNHDLDSLVERSLKLPLMHRREEIIVVGSRSHMNDQTKQFIDGLKQDNDQVKLLSRGSSLKLCMIAEGEADVYPRFGPIMEWDVAAGHAIVSASGGKMLEFETKEEVRYNKNDLMSPHFVCTR
ncbi:3'(2'),5'-bisphosphate nucleotidase CysQ [Marinifilum caeruleilacunae]|uniref:3'(2'),5'-bisphosphate nucleotidase CysQ n=1 Tax=Marinifilum caeruleilacunae TaxID=2499076 RepID=A0ABX1WT46_9BACT|nr:3'(2'),5'-bisphosphate nucleotidase CysQ [Marinifilum caeruleilacunae]NOU59253.1 3'(2'),5'-bisphosphate nucleotidase [Marinifilum caeruleilacunae]